MASSPCGAKMTNASLGEDSPSLERPPANGFVPTQDRILLQQSIDEALAKELVAPGIRGVLYQTEQIQKHKITRQKKRAGVLCPRSWRPPVPPDGARTGEEHASHSVVAA